MGQVERKRYAYNGPVFEFNKCVTPKWSAETCAVSERQARSNLTHQFKRDHGKAINAKITLTGKLVVVS